MANTITLGLDAKAILDSPAWKRAVEEAKGRLHEEWERTTSPEARERIWHEVHALDRIERQLRVLLGDGEYARHEESR